MTTDRTVAERSRAADAGDRLPVPPAIERARIEVYTAARAMWAITTHPIPADAPARFEAAVDALIEAAWEEGRP